jgi:hypothetical protein
VSFFIAAFRYGFVTFQDPLIARTLKEQGSVSFNGRTINVSEAVRKNSTGGLPLATPPQPSAAPIRRRSHFHTSGYPASYFAQAAGGEIGVVLFLFTVGRVMLDNADKDIDYIVFFFFQLPSLARRLSSQRPRPIG